MCRINVGSALTGCDWEKPCRTSLIQLSKLTFSAQAVGLLATDLLQSRDSVDVTSGQWNPTLSRTVSAISGYSRASDSVRERPGPSAPLSGPGLRSPSRRCCPLRPLWRRPPGLLPRRLRCSSTACTAEWERGWGRGLAVTVTRGTRPCWRRRWRLWFAASPNTRRVTAEVMSGADTVLEIAALTRVILLQAVAGEGTFGELETTFSCAICLEGRHKKPPPYLEQTPVISTFISGV